MTDPRARLLADLGAETDALDGLLRSLDEPAWATPTPAAGWSVHDQVSHLAYFDDACSTAIADPHRFAVDRAALVARGDDFPDRIAAEHRSLPVAELSGWWQSSRARLLALFATADPAARIPWYGPDMSLMSAATARLMETWAHGRDLHDAVGCEQPATDRLRHIAHLGVRTRSFSYALRGLDPPATDVRVELEPPAGGEPWTWGPPEAADRVRGPAEDFCLVVTQRRHRDDTDLETTGDLAAQWLTLAQAFAGRPGDGRRPRTTDRLA